jgi:hypothetical protein
MAIRSLTVGIFDKSREAERAVERLAEVGFYDTAYEDPAEERVRGQVPAGAGQISGKAEPGRPNLARAFKARLTEYQLPDEVIHGYAITFDHGGKFILVRTLPQRDEEVVKILQKSGASRVNRYDI